jgi:hypothetical protein
MHRVFEKSEQNGRNLEKNRVGVREIYLVTLISTAPTFRE